MKLKYLFCVLSVVLSLKAEAATVECDFVTENGSLHTMRIRDNEFVQSDYFRSEREIKIDRVSKEANSAFTRISFAGERKCRKMICALDGGFTRRCGTSHYTLSYNNADPSQARLEVNYSERLYRWILPSRARGENFGYAASCVLTE